MKKPLHYGIVGDGRAARHFIHYFSLLKIPFTQWSRGIAKETGSTPYMRLKDVDVLLVLISDSAIEPFLRRWPALLQKKTVHFSGSLVSELAFGFHPLMLFGKELYDLKTYGKIPFVSEEEGPSFQEIFPNLPNPHFKISKEQKPYYHALCVLSGNFTSLLWKKSFQEFKSRLGLPEEVLQPYLFKVFENIHRDPVHAPTGPLVRKDYETIQRNLSALAGDNYGQVYESFARIYASEYQENKTDMETA